MRKISEISAEKMRVKEKLDRVLANDSRDINLVRRAVRNKILSNQKLNNELERLLEQEYKLEREENEVNFKLQLIEAGKK